MVFCAGQVKESSTSVTSVAGSLGLLPSASLGDGKVGLYEPIHGSAPDIAGKGLANPYAMIMSGQMLLAWLGHKHQVQKAVEAAAVMERAVEQVIREAKTLTPDLGGKAKTRDFVRAVIARASDFYGAGVKDSALGERVLLS